jgi:rare lipoprotein A (peptidoglycan hydrolase)
MFWRKLLFSTFVCLLLASCTRKTKVGATCVSCKPYLCRGSWHWPQLVYDYDEIGLASWYGADCHGKEKATREKFDMWAPTAAHKTLPLPSVVKVTSLETGESLIVVIDDRGPFVYKGRIIDLSYWAAKTLRIANMKPSRVRVTCLVEDSLRLSNYIAKHCRRNKDRYGRMWWQIYMQEIARPEIRRRQNSLSHAMVLNQSFRKNRPRHKSIKSQTTRRLLRR